MASGKRAAGTVDDAVFTEWLSAAGARSSRLVEPMRLIREALAILEADAEVPHEQDRVDALRAIVDAAEPETLAKLAEVARGALNPKATELRETLYRLACKACGAMAAESLGDAGTGSVQRTTSQVFHLLRSHPEAFPVDDQHPVHTGDREALRLVEARVLAALRKCARDWGFGTVLHNGEPRSTWKPESPEMSPLGPVLSAWGVSRNAIKAAQTKVRRSAKASAPATNGKRRRQK